MFRMCTTNLPKFPPLGMSFVPGVQIDKEFQADAGERVDPLRGSVVFAT
jgi:hypothetical protein